LPGRNNRTKAKQIIDIAALISQKLKPKHFVMETNSRFAYKKGGLITVSQPTFDVPAYKIKNGIHVRFGLHKDRFKHL
jgi:hypothetical protein